MASYDLPAYTDGTKMNTLSNPSQINEAGHFLGGKQEGGLTDSEMNTIVC